jgi:hypothetical protein
MRRAQGLNAARPERHGVASVWLDVIDVGSLHHLLAVLHAHATERLEL